MTPMYCDFSGKLITPQFGTKEPQLNLDFFAVNNKIVSEESMKKINAIAEETFRPYLIKHQYSFKLRQQFISEIAAKYCNKKPSELPK